MSDPKTTEQDARDEPTPANDDTVPAMSISFSDLVDQSGLDEDTLLQRFAEVLARRGVTAEEISDATR